MLILPLDNNIRFAWIESRFQGSTHLSKVMIFVKITIDCIINNFAAALSHIFSTEIEPLWSSYSVRKNLLWPTNVNDNYLFNQLNDILREHLVKWKALLVKMTDIYSMSARFTNDLFESNTFFPVRFYCKFYCNLMAQEWNFYGPKY